MPLLTSYMWRLAFSRSLQQVRVGPAAISGRLHKLPSAQRRLHIT